MRDDLALLQKGADAGNELAIKALADQPDIEWPWHWWAYHELSTDRPATQGALLPIPHSAIRLMADEWHLKGKERSDFLYIIRELDGFVLNKAREQAERAMSSKGK